MTSFISQGRRSATRRWRPNCSACSRRQARAFAARLLAPEPQNEAARDIQQRIVLAHTLKGSARAIGAFALAKAAQAYEDALRANAPDADASPGRLLAALEHAREEISRLL